jgi:TfoX/Sxy family transcriptional regulator of competence genes
MAWKKSPPELVAAFERLTAGYAVERRSMFGYPAAFVKGNVRRLHEDRLVMRADDDAIADAKRRGATDFEPMAGRPMKGWMAVPGKLVANEALVRGWLDGAYRHISAMPAKKKKAAKRKPAAR